MKPSSVKQIILAIIKTEKIFMFVLFVDVLVVVMLSLVPAQILKILVDRYLTSDKIQNLWLPAIVYLATVFFIGISDFLKEIILTILGQKMNHKIRYALMEKTMKIPMEYYQNNSSGGIVSRLTNDVDAILNLFTNGIISMGVDGLKIIGIVISIWFFSWKLGFMMLLILPIIFFITIYFQKNMLKVQIENRIAIEKVNNHIPESIKNIQMISSFGKQKYMEERYKKYLSESYRTSEKVNFYDSVFSPVILIVRGFVIAVIAILSSRHLMILGISVGMVAATIELISNVFAPIENLGMELQNIQQSIAGSKRVDGFLNEPETEEIDKNTSLKNWFSEDSAITFKNVSFSYEDEKIILDNLNFTINAKENITILGRTGVGKSTFFKLILGLLQPQSGEIFIGDCSIRTIPNHEKRKIFGYVEQNFHFVMGTIEDQITLQDESITKDQIKKVMEFVGLHEYVLGFPEGYSTFCKPQFFSKGQQQLLSIARAIITNPPILLLDEMTANLDGSTEEEIIRVLEQAGHNRTIISISHRLSFVSKNTKKYTLEDGIFKEESF